MNHQNGNDDTNYLVRELAVQVKHIAKSLDSTQLQINDLVKVNHELTKQMTKWVEREDWKDKRISNLEEATDKQAGAIAELELWSAEQKVVSKISKVLSTSFIAMLSSVMSSVIVFFMIDK